METSDRFENKEALVKQLNEITGLQWTAFAFGAHVEVYTPMLRLGKLIFSFVDYPGKTAFVAGVSPSDVDADSAAVKFTTLTHYDVPKNPSDVTMAICWRAIIGQLNDCLAVLSEQARRMNLQFLEDLADKRWHR